MPEAAQWRTAYLAWKALGPTYHTVKQQKSSYECVRTSLFLAGLVYFRRLLNPMVSFPVNDENSFFIASWQGRGRGGCPPGLVPRESRCLVLTACEGTGTS